MPYALGEEACQKLLNGTEGLFVSANLKPLLAVVEAGDWVQLNATWGVTSDDIVAYMFYSTDIQATYARDAIHTAFAKGGSIETWCGCLTGGGEGGEH